VKINTESSFISPEGIEAFEKEFNGKYVLETCLKMKDEHSGATYWADFPAAIFYTEKKHPKGSNYFALYFAELGRSSLMITNGLSAVKGVIFQGLEAEGEVVYSRYRHDYRAGKNGAFVDGGRDYFRYGGDNFNDYNIVKFKVVEDRLEFINEQT
jgi:hypothetical protein